MSQVLVVDDFTTLRESMCAALETAGYSVRGADSGHRASAILAEAPVDLVVADIFMPDGDGFELIPKIKKEYPGAKILAVSGGGRFDASEFLAMAKKLGADKTLSKPFTLKELLVTVSSLVPGPQTRASS